MGFFEGLNTALDQSSQRALRAQQAAEMRSQQAGQDALGGVFGGIPGAQPMNPMNPMQKIMGALGLGGGQQQPAQSAGGAGQSAPIPGAQPMGGGAPQGGAPQGGAPQGGSPMPAGGQSQPFQGKLDWQSLAAQLKQRNPNIDARTMFYALNAAIPYMNSQSQQEWRQMSLGLRAQSEEETSRHHLATESQGDQKISFGKDKFEAQEQDKTLDRSQRQEKIDNQAAQFQQRQDRLKEEFNQRGQQAVARLQQAKTLADRTAAMREVEDVAKQQYQAQRALISSDGNVFMSPEVKKQVEDAARQQYDAATKRLDELKLKMRNQQDTGGASLGGAGQFSANNQTSGGMLTPSMMAAAAARRGTPVQPQGAAAATDQPKPGVVVNGYRYKGGDYDSQSSWEKVQ